MLIAFTFEAKQGKEAEFEAALNDPEAARMMAKKMGAVRNTLFLGEGRMIRILEFPEGTAPRSMSRLVEEDPEVHAFMARLGPLIKDGFDVTEPGSLDTFSKRSAVPLAFDVHPGKEQIAP
jgi:hypothetical protein